ncbi:DUF4296 domain-containing protein [Formosa sp. PL04]|uniref:DUF4296 domain-containing protein n=1 Tax=Formosa sp. PL04 TaxID=3081755 RepID=UPI002981192F|nr:DUF4296 domain-containing protein [Formosa sp. PL04]MDW5287285.1 DUF4296 domain-containing protein [Formosa sp. PL04]
MMKRLVLVIIIVFSVASCHQVKKPEKPKDLISKDKMVKVIIDMSLLTASKGIDKNALEKNGVSLQSLIYDKYGIDSLMLAESNEYYAYNIDEYEALYVKVNDSLTQLKELFNIEKEEAEAQKKKQDSIENSLKPKIKDDRLKVSKNLKTEGLPLPKNN